MKTTTTTLTALLFAFLFVGCAADPASQDPGVKADVDVGLHQGVEILDLQPGFSFTASFARGQDVIYLQAIRGQATPAEYREDPTFPQYEIDARITDEEGRILYIRRGGDQFVDPTWLDDLVMAESLPPSTKANVELFHLIGEATDALEKELASKGHDNAAGLIPELGAIRDFGRSAPSVVAASELHALDIIEREGFVRPEAGGGGSNGPEDAYKYFSEGWYFISVHTKGIALDIGEHSATRIAKMTAYNTYSYFDFCNHGTCASDMGQKCSLIQINKPAWTAPTCLTGYGTYSDNGGHNCHDDTRVQMAAYVYGAPNNGYQYWCNGSDDDTDISVNIWLFEIDQTGSPDCNNTTNKGYNFPGMLSFWTSNTNSAQQNTYMFAVTLAAGATYTFSTCGAGSGDTYLRLKYNGADVAYNDDACGLLSTITYKAPTAGVYYISAGCFSSNSCSGTVYVNLIGSDAPPAPPWNWYSVTNTNSATQYTKDLWYWLSAGYTYTFSTCGTSTTDTYLRLKYTGVDVAVNDDACGLQSSISYAPAVSGYYVINAGCYSSSSCTGTVNLTSVVNPSQPDYPENPSY
ncbi:PPC domain-containing protein [Myxococcota bacterium]|nr:PPC domain-containing protein [Myxococcota bacterium]